MSTLLCLHGITMSGASLLATLGPLAHDLRAAGFTLLAPDAPHRMTPEVFGVSVAWARGRYADVGQDAREDFREGRFWAGDAHYDWFDPEPEGRRWRYKALQQSLDALAEVTRGHHITGVLGFSQGAAMAALVAALGASGSLPWARDVRVAALLSGFRPRPLDLPDPWPAPGPTRVVILSGGRDPLFPGGVAHADLCRAFPPEAVAERLVPELGHVPPSDPALRRWLVDAMNGAAS